MSVRTDTVNLNINVNGNKAQKELNDLRKRAADLTLEMKSLGRGTADYVVKSKELAAVNTQMANLKKTIGITALTQKELIAELNKLKALKGSVIPFSNEYKELGKSIKEVESRLYNVRNGVQGFSSFFSKIKDEVKQFGAVALGFLGFQFLTAQFTNIIKGAGKLSDELADLSRVTGMTAAEATNLNSKFKDLDTRTSTSGLREIAIVAGKLGVAKNDIFEFTKAVDMLVVGLGDELGDADAITSTLGKILNVFDGKVDGDNISRLGNAFIELANSGSATGGFIADFDQRLSGIAKSAGISLGALSGLGAGLEEMGGRVESSATAVQKLVISIASDIPKAAKIAGQSTAEFAKLFKLDPTEAILRYSQGLVKNKQSFAEVTASFKEAGEEGARTVETILKLGTGADTLRKRIELGKSSMQETTAITEAFRLKNETFGATLDKLGKEFNRLVTSPAVTGFLQGAIEGALSFIKVIRAIPFPVTIAGFVALTGILLIYTATKIKAFIATAAHTAAEVISNTVLKLKTIVTNIAIVAQGAYITITNLLTRQVTIATAAQRLWNLAMSLGAGPIGILIALAGALAIGLTAIFSSSKQLTNALSIQNEMMAEAAKETAKQRSEIDTLTSVITSNVISLGTRKDALQKLISISPEYLGRLTLENASTLEGKRILDAYNKSLADSANIKAANAIKDRLYEKTVDLQVQKQELEIYKASGFNNYDALSSESRDALMNAPGGGDQMHQITSAIKTLDKQIHEQNQAVFSATTNVLNQTATQQKNRRDFLLHEITEARATANKLKSANSKDYDAANAKFEELRNKFNKEFGTTKKTDGTGDVFVPKKDTSKEDKAAEKKRESEYTRLKKEAEKFYNELQDLKNKTDITGDDQAQEIAKAKLKYADLLDRAKEYYVKQALSKEKFNEEEKIIEAAQRKELDEIFQKFYKKRFDESSAAEYEESLTARKNFSDKLKVQAAQDYADGKISKKQYAAEIKQIDKDETADRITIAEDYSGTVKKAATDVTAFKKSEEAKTTQDLINASLDRARITEADNLARTKRSILTSRVGSKERLQLEKDLLEQEKDKKLENEELTNEEILLIEAEHKQALKDMDLDFWKQKIDQVQQYIGYVTDAMGSLNTILNNKENAQFQKEKSVNDKKKKLLKEQLDAKLISQAQYDKKLLAIQEEQDKKERELKYKQAKREKALNIFNAIVNTASAIAEALPNIPLSIIAGVLGGLQIAAIASAPLPELGRGDWVRSGDRHSDASGGINAKIERDEAVMSAAAMTDKKQYTITGTTAQITSALNSRAGGVNWAGGAVVNMAPWMSRTPSRISASLPKIMEQGGVIRSLTPAGNSETAETNALIRILIAKQDENTAEIKTMKTNLKASVSIKEYREKEKLYEDSRKASGFAQ